MGLRKMLFLSQGIASPYDDIALSTELGAFE